MIEFILPGLAAALVFVMVVLCCPWRRALIKYHWVVDIGFTAAMMVLLAGTYSGAMTAAVGGIILTLILWTLDFFLTPIPTRSRQ